MIALQHLPVPFASFANFAWLPEERGKGPHQTTEEERGMVSESTANRTRRARALSSNCKHTRENLVFASSPPPPVARGAAARKALTLTKPDP